MAVDLTRIGIWVLRCHPEFGVVSLAFDPQARHSCTRKVLHFLFLEREGDAIVHRYRIV